MAVVLAALKAIAAIPAIGQFVENVVRELAAHFARKRWEKDRAAVQGAADLSSHVHTEEEAIAALQAWHRVGR